MSFNRYLIILYFTRAEDPSRGKAMADTTIIIKKRRRIIVEPKELKVKAPAEPVEVGTVSGIRAQG